MHTPVQTQTPETQTQTQNQVLYVDDTRELVLIETTEMVELRLKVRPLRELANSVTRVVKLYKRERLLEIYLLRDSWYGTKKFTAVDTKIRNVREVYEKIKNVKTVDDFEILLNELAEKYGGVE